LADKTADTKTKLAHTHTNRLEHHANKSYKID